MSAIVRIVETTVDGFNVRVEYKNIKRLYLRVKEAEGTVVVSAPNAISLERIRDFVRRNSSWVHLQQLKQRLALAKSREGGRFKLWGESRELKYTSGLAEGVRDDGQTLEVVAPAGYREEESRAVLESWLHSQFKAALVPLVKLWEERTGVAVRQVRIRRMTSRWGSCSPAKGNISINLELVHLPPEALEYIVVHEFMHFFEQSHNERFYRLMDRNLPGWKSIRRMLRRQTLV